MKSSKFASPHFWLSHLTDGLNAPMHILALAAGVSLVGNLRARIAFDLFERRPYAFGILTAADTAARLGVKRIAAIEFGVASGVGLRSMSRIAQAVSKDTGVAIDVVGFDTGRGMPAALDYRDHPEQYFEGDFAAPDPDALARSLPENTRLMVGNTQENIGRFISEYEGAIGFVSVDVDYYSSTKVCLELLASQNVRCLPWMPVFFDDVLLNSHNPWCGELLAISEFNDENSARKIAPYTALRDIRIMKSASWIRQMYSLHVLDHPARSVGANKPAQPRAM
jgi:hypothetical protein